jgi:hypothetical protein
VQDKSIKSATIVGIQLVDISAAMLHKSENSYDARTNKQDNSWKLTIQIELSEHTDSSNNQTYNL